MAGKAVTRIIGRLSKDPEMRYTPNGKAVTTLTIPVQERKDDETVWWEVTAWEKQAETLNQYAAKGTWLEVEGTPKLETWQDKNTGDTRAKMTVTLRNFTFCGGERASDGSAGENTQTARSTSQQPAQQATVQRNKPVAVRADEDLPF